MDFVADETLPAVRIFSPRRYQDKRGFFSEIWREEAMIRAGINVRFVQENHALSHHAGTIRGLHFQIGPSAQGKLVRCVRGSLLDIALDIRHGSPTFGRHATVVLSGENGKQLYVPAGFAHGYCSLVPDTEVTYKVTAYYDPASERGVAWDDPALGIEWPIKAGDAVLADKDRTFGRLADLPRFFAYADYPD